MGLHVVIIKDGDDKFDCYGPFKTRETAISWVLSNNEFDGSWWVRPLIAQD